VEDMGFLVVLVLIMIALAQWTTNIGANILPPAFIFANVGAPVVSFKMGCLICGVLGLLIQPWKFADQLVTVFSIISALLGAVAGIMICDYYIIRKRKIDLEALYDPNSYYKYWKGYNPAAYIAFIVGCILGLWWLEGSYFISIFSALFIYYIFMKVWVLKKYPQEGIE
jgi:NCS1 family nucleobase:cation symporter-1